MLQARTYNVLTYTQLFTLTLRCAKRVEFEVYLTMGTLFAKRLRQSVRGMLRDVQNRSRQLIICYC